MKILIDTREQHPLKFKSHVRFTTLKTGDYSILGHTNEILIERKSVSDFFSTFAITKNKQRAIKEFERLSKVPHWYLVVEASYHSIQSGYKYSRASGNNLIEYVTALTIHYGGHIIFANNRTEAANVIESIFTAYMIQCQRGFNI